MTAAVLPRPISWRAWLVLAACGLVGAAEMQGVRAQCSVEHHYMRAATGAVMLTGYGLPIVLSAPTHECAFDLGKARVRLSDRPSVEIE